MCAIQHETVDLATRVIGRLRARIRMTLRLSVSRKQGCKKLAVLPGWDGWYTLCHLSECHKPIMDSCEYMYAEDGG